jgi:hypothetical protein
MSVAEWVQLSKQDEKQAIRLAFETYYSQLSSLSSRLAKNTNQSEEMLCFSFYNCISKLRFQLKSLNLDEIFRAEFIRSCVSYVKSFGKEYFVSSTVDALRDRETQTAPTVAKHLTDFSKLKPELFLETLRSLVPAQRLVFNLVLVDGYTLAQAAELLECSPEAAKFNLEKAQLNFNKLILKLSPSVNA